MVMIANISPIFVTSSEPSVELSPPYLARHLNDHSTDHSPLSTSFKSPILLYKAVRIWQVWNVLILDKLLWDG